MTATHQDRRARRRGMPSAALVAGIALNLIGLGFVLWLVSHGFPPG